MLLRRSILAALIFVGFLVGLFFLLRPAPPPPVVLPNPNGYDDFVAAGKLLKSSTNSYLKMTDRELRDYVKENLPALKLMEDGLKKESRVPIQYSTNFLSAHMPELGGIKGLALAQAAQGRCEEMDGKTNEAARSYLKSIQLGDNAFRGGLLIDHLVDMSCESIGMTPLQAINASLDAPTARFLAVELEKLDSATEPISQIETRDLEWGRATTGARVYIQILTMAIQMRTFSPLAPAFKKAEQRTMTIEKQRRSLMLDLASRAFELEKARRPKDFPDLVPDYLKAIPVDPLTKTNLDYRF